jgi:hypothetical protein
MKDYLEGKSQGLIKVLSRYFLGRTEENTEIFVGFEVLTVVVMKIALFT